MEFLIAIGYSHLPNKTHDGIKDTMCKFGWIAKRHGCNKRHDRTNTNYFLKDTMVLLYVLLSKLLKDTME